MIPVEQYLVLGLVLFLIGAGGALLRRNPVMILMSIELMLAAVTVNLIAFSRMWGAVNGQLFSIFIMADAAAQTALALGIVVACKGWARPATATRSEPAEMADSADYRNREQPVAADAEEADSYAERLQP